METKKIKFGSQKKKQKRKNSCARILQKKKLKHVKHKYTNTLCIYAHHQPRSG